MEKQTVTPLSVDTMDLESETKQLHTSHTDRLSDTAEVVREVSKKIGKYCFEVIKTEG
jgi:hypothetical protein